MRTFILLAMTILLVFGLQAQTSVSFQRDTRSFYVGQFSTAGNITKNFTLAGFTQMYSTPENDNFSQVYSRYSISHSLPVEWAGLGGLSAFAKYEDCINFPQATQFRFGLSLQNDVNVLGNQGWLLLTYAPLNTVEHGSQFGASYNLPVFGAFAMTGFADLSLVDSRAIWRLEPSISASIEDNMSLLVTYQKNDYQDNVDGFHFGLKWAF